MPGPVSSATQSWAQVSPTSEAGHIAAHCLWDDNLQAFSTYPSQGPRVGEVQSLNICG